MAREQERVAAAVAVTESIGGARRALEARLREQRTEAKEATAEVSRLRTLAKREAELSDGVRAGIKERGEGSVVLLLSQASRRELAARAAVRVTTRKIASLDAAKSDPEEMDRRARQQLKVGRGVRPRKQVARGSRRRVMQIAQDLEPMAPEFLFYLNLGHINLFEPTSSPIKVRCKACRAEVSSWGQLSHWEAHKAKEASLAGAAREGSSGGRPRSRATAAPKEPVSDAVLAVLKSEIESGKGAPAVAKVLNEGGHAHPSGKPWDHHRVRAAYRDATGITDWKAMRKANPAKRTAAKDAPAKKTTRLPKPASKTATTRKSGSAAKTTAARATAAKKTTAAKTSTARKRGGDLAAGEAKSDPKPQKAEKATRRR